MMRLHKACREETQLSVIPTSSSNHTTSPLKSQQLPVVWKSVPPNFPILNFLPFLPPTRKGKREEEIRKVNR